MLAGQINLQGNNKKKEKKKEGSRKMGENQKNRKKEQSARMSQKPSETAAAPEIQQSFSVLHKRASLTQMVHKSTQTMQGYQNSSENGMRTCNNNQWHLNRLPAVAIACQASCTKLPHCQCPGARRHAPAARRGSLLTRHWAAKPPWHSTSS